MSGFYDDHIVIPTSEDLQKAVVPRRPTPATPPDSPESAAKVRMPSEGATATERLLSPEAESFLRHAAEPRHYSFTLEERWKALGITSGRQKESILDELRLHGFIRLERKGRGYQVHLYTRAYEYLGLPAPTGEGIGGTSHRLAVKHMAAMLKRKGYEVHIEREVGVGKKRVDVVAYGPERIIGVEVGLSDVRQEVKNLREDLNAGVLDLLLFVTTDTALLEKLKTAAMKDPVVSTQLHRIKFYLLGEETES